jgi:hypothetical protein
MKKYQEKGTFIVENHNCVELQLVDKNRVDYLKKKVVNLSSKSALTKKYGSYIRGTDMADIQ